MQQDLSQITRELRKETCPRRVLNKVRGQISAMEGSRGRLPYATALALAGVVVVCCFAIWLSQGNKNSSPQATLVAHPQLDRAQVANQAEDALALVGSELLEASAHSEKIISDSAVPPLRNSIEIAKNKIINPMEL